MMLKKLFAFCLTLLFALSCFSGFAFAASGDLNGKYPVQQASIDDMNGEYTLMLLNTPADASPIFRTNKVQMARLTDEEISNGEKTYAEIKGEEAIMHLTEDFRIEYIHNETQTVENPQTGQTETVIVRRESNFWTPFAGAMAGQALGSLLFTPRYYMPPAYVGGGPLTGYGGYGNTYNQAVKSYRSNYNASPAIEKNRKTFRTAGNIKNSTNKSFGKTNSKKGIKSSGSGVGSSNLKTSGKSNRFKQPSKNRFGSNNTRRFRRPTTMRRSRGFGGRSFGRRR